MYWAIQPNSNCIFPSVTVSQAVAFLWFDHRTPSHIISSPILYWRNLTGKETIKQRRECLREMRCGLQILQQWVTRWTHRSLISSAGWAWCPCSSPPRCSSSLARMGSGQRAKPRTERSRIWPSYRWTRSQEPSWLWPETTYRGSWPSLQRRPHAEAAKARRAPPPIPSSCNEKVWSRRLQYYTFLTPLVKMTMTMTERSELWWKQKI